MRAVDPSVLGVLAGVSQELWEWSFVGTGWEWKSRAVHYCIFDLGFSSPWLC